MYAALEIRPTDPAQAAAQALIAELDAYQAPMYPSESNHLDDVEELQKPNIYFVGGFLQSQLIACGAAKRLDEYAELKRFYVAPAHRGKGVAKAVLSALENWMRAGDCRWAKLETGIYQPEAIALYQSQGYTHCKPFGAYREDPVSVYMEKYLG